ncbi:MAG: ribosomal RNA small subunit methyltransferase D [Lysobacterales bacterium]|jgi:16S rRNA (guanine966-N2)-methyltransferase|nr:MAG: ribosomal RNA small subunit methyltransferase D [Xanthomonadales bacterium]
MRSTGRIRIIGGRLRGLRLPVPPVPGLRPSPDRLRETLFNWLMPVLPGAAVLDPFAGTGALVLEALSRGAEEGLACERHPLLCRALSEQIERVRPARLRVRCGDALEFLDAEPPRRFHLAFLDPPFDRALWESAARLLESRGWLDDEAWIYIESPPRLELALPPSWRLWRTSRAGEALGRLYRRLSAPLPDAP